VTPSKYAARIEMQIKNTPASQKIDFDKPMSVEVVAPFSPPVSQGGLDSSALILVDQNYKNSVETTVSRSQPAGKSTSFDNIDGYSQSLQSSSMMTMTILLIQ